MASRRVVVALRGIAASDEIGDDIGQSRRRSANHKAFLRTAPQAFRAQQSGMITDLIQNVREGFTPAQVPQTKTAFREKLADAGLRLDDAEHQDEAREDFRFLRRFRLRWDGASTKIGNAVLAAVILIAGGIIATGFWAWINSGGRPP